MNFFCRLTISRANNTYSLSPSGRYRYLQLHPKPDLNHCSNPTFFSLTARFVFVNFKTCLRCRILVYTQKKDGLDFKLVINYIQISPQRTKHFLHKKSIQNSIIANCLHIKLKTISFENVKKFLAGSKLIEHQHFRFLIEALSGIPCA